MNEFFNKYKIAIFRTVGVFMLLIAFVTYFWVTPKEGYTKSEIAAANVARMEASVSGGGSGEASKSDTSKFLKELKETQERQVQYLIIITMILGVGFLGYSFIKPKS